MIKWLCALVTTVLFAVIIILNISFSINCTNYLELASNANSIPLASENLNMAIDYLETSKLTSGYAYVLIKSPKDDIGYWYRNLKTAQEEMTRLKDQALSPLEQSNVLMKLRETLMKDKEVIKPIWISLYPHVGLLLSLTVGFLLLTCALFSWDD